MHFEIQKADGVRNRRRMLAVQHVYSICRWSFHLPSLLPAWFELPQMAQLAVDNFPKYDAWNPHEWQKEVKVSVLPAGLLTY